MTGTAPSVPVTVAEGSDGECVEKKTEESFFSFAEEGHLTWWSAVILGVIGLCSLVSFIYIVVVSARLRQPEALRILQQAQCPSEPTPFDAWLPSCRPSAPGSLFGCHGSYDCRALGSDCASWEVLDRMQCTTHDGKRACALPSSNPPVDGYCRNPGSVCKRLEPYDTFECS